MRIALKFGYNGQNFYGFARQPNLKTVEGKIIEILKETNYIINPSDNQFRYASRTDKGVSALSNIIAFNTEKKDDKIFNEINLDKNIIFYGIQKVDADFFPRYAKHRTYRYYLQNRDYDVEKIMSASKLFVGKHDFTNFAKIEKGKNPERTIENIIINTEKNYFIINFYAQTFLWNQIRRIVSALEKIGKNALDSIDIKYALENPDDKKDFGVISAEPLILMDVSYDFEFIYGAEHFKKLKELKNRVITTIKKT